MVTLENNEPESQEYKDANEKRRELNTRIEQDNKQRYELIRAQGYNPVTFTSDEMMADLIAKTAVNSSPAKPQVSNPRPTIDISSSRARGVSADKWGVKNYVKDVEEFRKKVGIETFDGIKTLKHKQVI